MTSPRHAHRTHHAQVQKFDSYPYNQDNSEMATYINGLSDEQFVLILKHDYATLIDGVDTVGTRRAESHSHAIKLLQLSQPTCITVPGVIEGCTPRILIFKVLPVPNLKPNDSDTHF